MKPKPALPKFEDVYRRHPFAPLVRLAMTLAAWVMRRQADRAEKHRSADRLASLHGKPSNR